MTTWYVQDGSERRTMSEKKLRSELRENDLKGTELARPEHSKEWKPLHDYPLFSEEVAHTGPPAAAAWKRDVISWCVHLAIFIVVNSILGFSTWILLGWGIFVLLHTLRAGPSMHNLVRHWQGRPPVVAGEATPRDEERSFLRDVDQAIEDVMVAFHEDPDRDKADEPDLARIYEMAERLNRQRRALLDAADEPTRLRLQDELAAAQADAEGAPDARTAEAFEAEATEVAKRLASMEAAHSAGRRIEARQKTLLHQLQRLRLALLRSSAEEALPAPDLAARVERIRGELEASAEVEEELARARRASQPMEGKR